MDSNFFEGLPANLERREAIVKYILELYHAHREKYKGPEVPPNEPTPPSNFSLLFTPTLEEECRSISRMLAEAACNPRKC